MTTLHDQWTALYTAGRVRWMPGMLTDRGRVTDVGLISNFGIFPVTIHGEDRRFFAKQGPRALTPDFSDPATIGCLLHQAREAWDSPRLQTSPMLQPAPLEWICYPNACEDDGRRYLGDSEPAAILAAIAAAPPKVKP
jgi:hypothetical protein